MKKIVLSMLAVASLGALPSVAGAQGIGVGARAGLVGLGAEGAIALGERAQARAGFGLLPLTLSPEIDDIDFELELPKTWINVGIDVFLAGPLRVGGGVLFKPDDPTLEATPTSPVDIGGQMFDPAEIGTLKGTLASKGTAPYAILGFGHMTGLGVGLYADVGVAFLGDPEITLDAEGGNYPNQAELQTRLDQEADNLEDDAGQYLSFWPFLSVGVKLGIG